MLHVLNLGRLWKVNGSDSDTDCFTPGKRSDCLLYPRQKIRLSVSVVKEAAAAPCSFWMLRRRDTSFAGAMKCIKFVVSWTCH